MEFETSSYVKELEESLDREAFEALARVFPITSVDTIYKFIRKSL